MFRKNLSRFQIGNRVQQQSYAVEGQKIFVGQLVISSLKIILMFLQTVPQCTCNIYILSKNTKSTIGKIGI